MSRWIESIFESKTAQQGGVVRRAASSVESHASFEELEREVKRRGFHMVRHEDQFVIFCGEAQVTIIC